MQNSYDIISCTAWANYSMQNFKSVYLLPRVWMDAIPKQT